jgi:AAA family ATP:ADP antiporter
MWIERLLHLRAGDFRRGFPLFLYYLLIIGSSQVGQIARDALILDRFSALQLPYLDIAVSLLIGLVIALYIRLAQNTNLGNLLIGSLCLYVVAAGGLWWALHYYQRPWVYLVLYLWVGIFGALAPAQVWTLANFVWTTREAKRLFGILGSGGIVGGIFAGFLSARMTTSFEAESLLLLMAIPLAIAIAVVAMVWRDRRPGHGHEASNISGSAPKNLTDSLRLIVDSPHLRVIASLVFLSSAVATIAAWQMKAVAQQTYVSKNALAVFFGHFDGYVCILALLAQIFITGKVLQRFGIGIALVTLPLSLFAGSTAMVISGSLWAVCVVKGADRVFRYSIDTSAQQLLFLPVSARVKLQVKSFIDTVVWRFGGGFAGVLLLLFATRLGFSPAQVGWLCLVFVVAWLVTAVSARRQYVATLGENIQQGRDDDDGPAPVYDSTTSNVLMSKLRSGDPNDILHALSLYEMGHQQQVLAAVHGLLDHPGPEIRARAIAVLREASDLSVHEAVSQLLHDDDLGVRTEALSYLTVHDHIDPIAHLAELGKFADFSILSATIAFLARPGEAQNIDAAQVMLDVMVKEEGDGGTPTRRTAARLIGSLPDYFEDQLGRLLQDSDPEVVRHALRSMSVLGKLSLSPLAVQRLADPELSEEAVEALAGFDNSVLDILVGFMNDSDLRIDLRRMIPEVLLRIGTPQAARALADDILQADSVLRYRIIVSLNKLQELHKHPPLDRELVETVMVAEIMGHYRSYQILGTLKVQGDGLLRDAIAREVERIFRLMKLLFPSIDLENAYRGIQSKDHVAHANALEFLENTLSPTLRRLLLPLIDGEVSVTERIRLADKFLNTKLESDEEAVAALVHSEDPWQKSCAVYAIGKLGLKSFEAELARLAQDPDPFLQRRIAAAQGMLNG